jgi:phosphatidylglycerol:prolipoprotein diacylglycerol transferase
MLPVLQIGPLALPTYPLSLLLAIWAALAVGAGAARRQGLAGDHVYNAGFYGLIAAVVVGRLAHVAAFWSAYRTQPLEIVGFNTRAFLWWPGLMAALVMAGWYIRRHRLQWVRMVDAGALGVLIGISIASLGAFLTGRGLGAPTKLPWGISTWDLPRHPFQLYWMLAALAAAALVAWGLTRQRKPGAAALVALVACGFAALLIEPARADSLTTAGGFRLAQLLGLTAAILALWGLRKRSEPAPEETPGADQATLSVE